MGLRGDAASALFSSGLGMSAESSEAPFRGCCPFSAGNDPPARFPGGPSPGLSSC